MISIFLEILNKEKEIHPADGSEEMRSKEGVLHQSCIHTLGVTIFLESNRTMASVPSLCH